MHHRDTLTKRAHNLVLPCRLGSAYLCHFPTPSQGVDETVEIDRVAARLQNANVQVTNAVVDGDLRCES